ncbi:MAG: putative nucleic acid-binding Zn-ribbon protein, partial [Candidatus Azotimanducaceae bacterium]
DAADTAENAELAAPADTDVSLASQLLTLQRIDTEADQLTVRRQRLPERDDLATRTDQMTTWEKRRTQVESRLDELTTVIESAEAANAALTADRGRLEAQLKTVIAPREAEALMHEIETINGKRDELDNTELAALEEQAALDDDLTAHLGNEESLRAALRSSDEALARVCDDIDVELAGLANQRIAALELLDSNVVSHYDAVRSSAGVAVAELKGHRCEGCHLDLSAAEVDTAKEEAAESGYTDCPQCGRMLIV